MEESPERTLWYLMQGDNLIVVANGGVIDSTYKVEEFANGQLHFRYLPMDVRQRLAIVDGQ